MEGVQDHNTFILNLTRGRMLFINTFLHCSSPSLLSFLPMLLKMESVSDPIMPLNESLSYMKNFGPGIWRPGVLF